MIVYIYIYVDIYIDIYIYICTYVGETLIRIGDSKGKTMKSRMGQAG